MKCHSSSCSILQYPFNKTSNLDLEYNELFSFTRDQLGSIQELVDHNGKVVQRYRYSTFGKTTVEKADGSTDHQLVENIFSYTGREYDFDTQFYGYRNRYYSPEMGRFISQDPIGLQSGDLNFYRYVRNNPLKYVDPLGTVVIDNTIFGIPRFIQNGPLYQNLNSSSQTITITDDLTLQAAGATRPSQGGQTIHINPLNQIDSDDYNDTILHELNHANQNIITNNDFSMGPEGREIFDTDVLLPYTLQGNGLNSCGLK